MRVRVRLAFDRLSAAGWKPAPSAALVELDDARLRSRKPPETGRLEVWDTKVQGLILNLTSSGGPRRARRRGLRPRRSAGALARDPGGASTRTCAATATTPRSAASCAPAARTNSTLACCSCPRWVSCPRRTRASVAPSPLSSGNSSRTAWRAATRPGRRRTAGPRARAPSSPAASGWRTAEAQRLLERLLSLRNDLGLLAEEHDPSARRMLGNFPQAFSHVALVNTAYTLSGAGTQDLRSTVPADPDPEAGDEGGPGGRATLAREIVGSGMCRKPSTTTRGITGNTMRSARAFRPGSTVQATDPPPLSSRPRRRGNGPLVASTTEDGTPFRQRAPAPALAASSRPATLEPSDLRRTRTRRSCARLCRWSVATSAPASRPLRIAVIWP